MGYEEGKKKKKMEKHEDPHGNTKGATLPSVSLLTEKHVFHWQAWTNLLLPQNEAH